MSERIALGDGVCDAWARLGCGAGYWDLQFLADADHVSCETVGLLDCADACAVASRDMAKGVALFDDVSLSCLREPLLCEYAAASGCKEGFVGKLSSADLHGFC